MRKISLILFTICIFATAWGQKKTIPPTPSAKFKDFMPVDPIDFFDDVEMADAENGTNFKYIKTLTKEEMLRYLTNETVLISIAEVDKDGQYVYVPSRISKKNTQYIITMSYVKYATIDVRQQGDIIGEACVGVGFRVEANISSRADDINLGDLFTIGMAVKDRKAYGSLRMEAIGLHDPEITSIIPLPSEISGAAIQAIMQGMSTIKYKLYDNTTRLSPQIMGVRIVKDGTSLQELSEILMRYHLLGKKNTAPKPVKEK